MYTLYLRDGTEIRLKHQVDIEVCQAACLSGTGVTLKRGELRGTSIAPGQITMIQPDLLNFDDMSGTVYIPDSDDGLAKTAAAAELAKTENIDTDKKFKTIPDSFEALKIGENYVLVKSEPKPDSIVKEIKKWQEN